jgi:hypothetical protein
MIRFDDYPYAQVREACGTVLGRVGLVVLAALGGSMAAGVTATHSLAGLWLGFIGLPGFSLASLFYGVGIFVLPLLLFYAIASIRCGWPLRLTLICFVLMWWNIHQTIRWSMYDSPMAKKTQKIQAELRKAIDEAIEEGQREARKKRQQ